MMLDMPWDALKIRHLRRRMGWSQSDLARRLSCESKQVLEWEQGQLSLLETHIRMLDMLQHQADSEADQITSCPLAEIVMDETRESQINLEKVKRRFSENN
jgi:transcriptional regulator with XRE-family HTH domain